MSLDFIKQQQNVVLIGSPVQVKLTIEINIFETFSLLNEYF